MRHASILVALALTACQGNTQPSAPTVEIEPEAPTTGDDLIAVITVDAVDPDKNDEVSYTWAWELNGVPQPEITGHVVSADLTSRGETWTVAVTATDREAASATTRKAVTVRNTVPVVDSLEFTPAAPNTSDDLVVVASGSDADGEPLQYRYTWSRDGETIAVAGDTVLSALTAPNQVWEVSVIADDGFSQSVPKALGVTIANFAPVIDSVELTPSEPRAQSTIQALVQASDGDGHPITLAFRWLVNGSEVASDASDSLSGASFAKGDLVSVEVTPNDGYQSGVPVTSSAVAVLNTPPTLDGAALTGEIFEATTATCAGLGWFDADDDPEGLQIRWEVNGASAGTSATLDGTSFDKGDAVQCFATPHDGDEAGSEVASAVVSVSNTPPTLDSVDLSPTSPRAGDTVSATLNGAADVDGDDLSFQYAWQVNGASAGTAATLGGTSFAKGDTIALQVTPSDGDDVGAPVMSGAVTAINSPPGAPVLALGPAFDKVDLHCELAAPSRDPDADPVTYVFTWTTGGVAYTGPVLKTDHPGDTVPASALYVGDVWACAATPSDGDEDGPEATSAPAKVQVSNDGASRETAAVTCNELLNEHPSKASGVYWIDPDDDGDTRDAYQAFCDMTSDGGGWTLMAWTGNSATQPYGVPYPGNAHCPGLACLRGSGVPKGKVGELMARSTELAKAQSTSAMTSYAALEDYTYAGKYVYGDLTGLDTHYGMANCDHTGTGGSAGTYTSIVGPTTYDGTPVFVAAGFRYSGDYSSEASSYLWNVGEPAGFCAGTGSMPGSWMGTWSPGNYGPHLQGSHGAHSAWAR